MAHILFLLDRAGLEDLQTCNWLIIKQQGERYNFPHLPRAGAWRGEASPKAGRGGQQRLQLCGEARGANWGWGEEVGVGTQGTE